MKHPAQVHERDRIQRAATQRMTSPRYTYRARQRPAEMLQSVACLVGVGKSHIAQALAHLAIRSGADARFMKTSRVLAHLAGGRADRTWDKRLAELTRPTVLVLDDFAMRELTAPQADDLYELISERAGKSLILTSNRAPADWYPLFPNPVVAALITPGPPHQQQPPGLHERAQLPAEQTARACRPHREHERQLK